MNINLKLDSRFAEACNRLRAKYGEKMAKLNGFSDHQLSLTEFIDAFRGSAVADLSIDGSSNVKNKDIVTLEKEMPKPLHKLLAFNKIYYELAK